MSIPDEAREAMALAMWTKRGAGLRDKLPGPEAQMMANLWVMVDDAGHGLTAAGYTVVKVTDLHQQAAATPDDMDVVARRLGYVPVPDERALERTIHNSICPCDAYVNPMAPDSCAGERTMAMATARRAVLALLRGEGQ